MSTSSIRDLALLEADASAAVRADAAGRDADSLLIEAIVDAVLLVDADGLIARCNPAVEPLFGYPPADLLGRSIGLLLPALQGEGPRRELLDALSQADQPHEVGRLGFELNAALIDACACWDFRYSRLEEALRTFEDLVR